MAISRCYISFAAWLSSELSEVIVDGSGTLGAEAAYDPDERRAPLDSGGQAAASAVSGEVDILKTLQLKPGVQSGGEGTTGLFVRGGAADQNLVLLDDALVYNPSHLFGLFSVFNPTRC